MSAFACGQRVRITAPCLPRRLARSGRVIELRPAGASDGRGQSFALYRVRFDSGHERWLPADWLVCEPRPDFTAGDWPCVGWQPNPFIVAHLAAWMREMHHEPFRRCRG